MYIVDCTITVILQHKSQNFQYIPKDFFKLVLIIILKKVKVLTDIKHGCMNINNGDK